MKFSKIMMMFCCLLSLLLIMPLNGQEKTFSNSIGMEFILIPAGSFMMGTKGPDCSHCPKEDDPFTEKNELIDCKRKCWEESGVVRNETPQHKVVITKPFYLGKYEITQEEWYEVMGNNPAFFKSEKAGEDSRRYPVENISWEDSQKFITKLNANEGKKYRLPTEVEWEYACRAGTTTDFNKGDNLTTNQANYNGNYPCKNYPNGKYLKKTTSVGNYPSNNWGLYDMHGNVWEWCQDNFHDNYHEAPVDGNAWESRKIGDRVLRGGDWNTGAKGCRSAFRFYRAGGTYNGIGFRLVLEP